MVTASTAGAAVTAGALAGGGSGAVGKGLLAKIGLGALIGPLIGLVLATLDTRAAASTARSKPERDCVIRYSKWIIAFCFIMSIGLAGVLSMAGKFYEASAVWIVIGISLWATVYAWLAIGDVAISPLQAFGGVAVAPIAIGAITVGVLSLSLYWGIAFGVLAVGSLAFGWWALGFASAGVKCAIGFAAVARDYAIGLATQSGVSGTAAKEWLKTEWAKDFMSVVVHQAQWWILGFVLLVAGLKAWKSRRTGLP